LGLVTVMWGFRPVATVLGGSVTSGFSRKAA
jgi:hypothetical protein